MKKNILILILTFLVFPSSLYANELVKEEKFNIFLGEWFSSADSSWDISGSGYSSGLGKNISVRSRLEYNDIDSNISIIGGHLNVSSKLTIRAAYGSGTIDDGTVVDHDWITVPVDGVYNLKMSESQEKGTGDTSIFDIGGLLLVRKPNASSKLSLYVGYLYYEDNVLMTNGEQTHSDNTYCTGPNTYCFDPVGTPITGLRSTFDFQWQFLKMGVEGEVNKNKFDFKYGVYYLHLLDYRGEGFWNLRNLTFIHKADQGYGVDANISSSYAFSKSIKLQGGYRYFLLTAKNGVDTTYDGGSVSTQPLDEVKAKRHGPYLSLEVNF